MTIPASSPFPSLHRILVAEDNNVDARYLEAMLAAVAGEAFQIQHVRSMRELDAAVVPGEPLPDALILDLGLPDSDGLQTFEHAAQALPGVAILILTANADSGVALAAVAAGAQDYLVKGQVDGNAIAKALTFAIERAGLDRRARAGESALATHRRVSSVAQLAASTAHELQTAIEMALTSNLTVATAISKIRETMIMAERPLDPGTKAAVMAS
ncbi:MAG: response regulator, partial [Planctomycetes bacterium]|nr:response regulator [Planctomycetota bacterium]